MAAPLSHRLAPFEEYMVLDDRPAYPMHIWCRLRLRGQVNRTALETSLRETLAMHPLLAARLDRTNPARPQWRELPAGSALPLSWSTEPLTEVTTAALDLDHQAALQVLASAQGEQVDLVLCAHHAAVDGLGLFGFVSDWLQHYHALIASDATSRPAPRDVHRLPGRGEFWFSSLGLLARVPRLLLGLPNTIRFNLHRAAPLTSALPVQGEAGQSYSPGWLTHTLAPEETAALRQRAKKLGTSLNDLLIRDLLLTLDRWQRSQGENSQRDWLRISVPVNLRLASEAKLTAANVVSMVFIDRRDPLLQQPAPLLASIQQQMNRIKRHRLGLIFPLMLGLLRSLGRLGSMTDDQRCRATTVLTNLGDPYSQVPLPRDETGHLQAGDVTLAAIELIPPLRPFTQVAFSIVTYAAKLHIGLHYDRCILTAAQASELLGAFAATIQAAEAL
ncbi:acyltransferase PapA5 [Anatilimnocola aggregata]|uniref:Acyltransferase PapA5 n=1 Tax=Anatilimnocola aggregata TaxID=2528021 RepID=A0A517Y4F6_9BACT|nr:hypothetical protein [Anatilimnocola aggregata]QDU25124.1 acyltransferase PapA5 [Anatilimnocola aggregata]